MLGKRTYAYLMIAINSIWLIVVIYEWRVGISELSFFSIIAPIFNGLLGFYLLYEINSKDKKI